MDRWLGAGLVAAALILYVFVLPAQIVTPRFQVGGAVGGLAASPLFFPRFIAVVLGLLGALIFLRGRTRAQTLRAGEGFTFGREAAVRVAGAALILVLYLALLDTVGYLLLTPVTLAALIVFLGFRRWPVLVPVAVLTPIVVYYGFRWGMKILLPEGLLD
ncbi:MAG: tripartite tricarboxylate transporter TctB family protein [Candidatus Rokubacteria bacterium]|nr:tripartite tricarboxylate transporter TctB family protein [Candidatus Rokubacteria bacterium]